MVIRQLLFCIFLCAVAILARTVLAADSAPIAVLSLSGQLTY